MPNWLIIIIEILVRLLILFGLTIGAYLLFNAKNPHKVWGWIATVFAVVMLVNLFIPSSYTAENRLTFSKNSDDSDNEDTSDLSSKKNSSKDFDKESESMEKEESKGESQAQSASIAKRESEKKKNTVKVGNIAYERVALTDFTNDPEKFDGQNIQTRGQVVLIQKDPDNRNMLFVVLAPIDTSSSSGIDYSGGTVAQVPVDVKPAGLVEGQNITVDGGALTDEVTLNGKTLASSIIVDYVK